MAWPLLTPLPAEQNATLVAEKAALQGQLQLLEGQLGSLQGRAQELLLQSQRAQEYSSRLQVGGSCVPIPHPTPAHCPLPAAPLVLCPDPVPCLCSQPAVSPCSLVTCLCPDPSHLVLCPSFLLLPTSTYPSTCLQPPRLCLCGPVSSPLLHRQPLVPAALPAHPSPISAFCLLRPAPWPGTSHGTSPHSSPVSLCLPAAPPPQPGAASAAFSPCPLPCSPAPLSYPLSGLWRMLPPLA